MRGCHTQWATVLRAAWGGLPVPHDLRLITCCISGGNVQVLAQLYVQDNFVCTLLPGTGLVEIRNPIFGEPLVASLLAMCFAGNVTHLVCSS